MVSLERLEDQLRAVGRNLRFWGRTEMRELGSIITPEEEIKECVNGRYENGFALLCVTDKRILLVDKKPLFLMLEDIRFDMVTEVDYSEQAFMGALRIVTPGRTLIFTSWNQERLRSALDFIQLQVTKYRQAQQGMFGQPTFRSQPGFMNATADAPMAGYFALAGHDKPKLHYVPSPLFRKRVPKYY